MLIKRAIANFILMLFLSLPLTAQEIDSLISVLEKTSTKDTNYVLLSNLISVQLQEKDTEKALTYAKKALQVAQEINFAYGITEAQTNIGWIYYRRAELDKAFEYSQKALKNVGKLKNLTLEAKILTNIGAIYNEQQKYQLSLDYFEQAYLINQKIPNNDYAIGRNLGNLAYTAFKLQNMALARQYSQKALVYNEKTGQKYLYAFALRTEADILLAEKDTTQALQQWKKSLQIAQELNNNALIISNLNRISNVYFALKQYTQALYYIRQASTLAQKYGFRSELRDSYLMLAKIYATTQDFGQAYIFHTRFFAVHDSIFNENNQKKINQLQTSFETERKEKEIIQLKAKQKEEQFLYKQQTTRQQWIIFTAAAALLTSMAITWIIFRSRKQIKKAFFLLEDLNAELLQKNEEINQQKEEILQTLEVLEEQRLKIEQHRGDILDSIQYATRIQEAIMPTEQHFKEAFGENQYFIFHRPKDMVSGDFYFLEHFTLPDHTQKTILAVVDCTGHGVPGAFMSMIGTQILTEIVLKNQVWQPAQILEILQREVKRTLKQNENNNKDGMDISILSLTRTQERITIDFAAAIQSLYVVIQKNDDSLLPLVEYKGSKISIGGIRQKVKEFRQEQIFAGKYSEVKEIMLYLATDGYQDQFGGERNRKFGKPQLRKLFQSMATYEVQEQGNIIAHNFDNWKKIHQEKQIDDVTVVGIKIANFDAIPETNSQASRLQ